MSETVNQENATVENQTAEEKVFTQAELNKQISERLARERQKYEGFDELKEKAAKFDEMEAASKSELQKATERAEKLEKELTALKKSNEVRVIREKVAKETGVPINLLTGESEEACNEQAKAILAYAQPNQFLTLKDGGEVQNINEGSARDQFADWAKRAFN